MNVTASTEFAILVSLVAAGCGTGTGGSAPAAPSPSTNTSSSVTIDAAEINGPYSFFPSPVIVRPGQTVLWRNTDTVTHHVVFDDGSIDTGTLAPSTLSQPEMISGSGGNYHCSIHPSMVGEITVGSAAAAGR
jgi:plastocyanin